ncbi:MAG TPA: glycosyltransferase family 2 protein [Phycisphaerales bacterium]|nr:glycosyltransferase family 2 protein [Phycisphaerales bacterium]
MEGPQAPRRWLELTNNVAPPTILNVWNLECPAPDPWCLLKYLIAIPTYNEQKHVSRVLKRVLEFADNVLVIDDGSTDGTPCLLPNSPVEVIRHAVNRGYGRSLQDAFRWAEVDHYDWVITMDCDEQHEPEAIPRFVEAAQAGTHDIISGSRYLEPSECDDSPPANRRKINAQITRELNECLGLAVTDAFCGFKAYRLAAIRKLHLDVDGYEFPMQFWVQAVASKLRIREIPVRLIYNDPNRTFGGPLDDDCVRIAHYRNALEREIARCADRLPASALRASEMCEGNSPAECRC